MRVEHRRSVVVSLREEGKGIIHTFYSIGVYIPFLAEARSVVRRGTQHAPLLHQNQ